MRISESSRIFVSWTSALCINLNPSFLAPCTVAIFIPSNREKKGAEKKQETNANISILSILHARIGKCSIYSLWKLLTRLIFCNNKNCVAWINLTFEGIERFLCSWAFSAEIRAWMKVVGATGHALCPSLTLAWCWLDRWCVSTAHRSLSVCYKPKPKLLPADSNYLLDL